MELKLTTASGKASTKSVEVSDVNFDCAFNEPLVHQVVTAYLAGARAGTVAQKNRTQVRGGGAKPWRQKGTGRARAGTTRSPIWRTGGVTFAARPRDYSQKVNKKMYRKAIRAIISELHRQERLLIVDDFSVKEAKTKPVSDKLNALGISNALIVTASPDEALYLSVRNLPHVEVCASAEVDPVSLIQHDNVVMTVAAIKQIEERLS
jgi:large subunit ribosomal protein L4